jgi:hypothetical protein
VSTRQAEKQRLRQARLAREASGRTVDGIRCQSSEQTLFHIHAHLAVYVGGRPRALPEGIGIAPARTVEPTSRGPFVAAGSCLYWLHSHTRDGIIHIESPPSGPTRSATASTSGAGRCRPTGSGPREGS